MFFYGVKIDRESSYSYIFMVFYFSDKAGFMVLRCELMEHGLSFELDVLYDCCILHHNNLGMPVIKKPYNGEDLDWDAIFEIKKGHYLNQIEKTLPECEGCLFLKEREAGEYEKYISWIMFNQSKLCNSNCIYCGDNNYYNLKFYDTYPIIKKLIEKKYFKKGGLVIFQGGEPTLMNNFREILNLFVENEAEIKINTSAIKFSEEICSAMEKGNTMVCISLDSPDREVYKRVKLTDKFDTVIGSIKRYVACQTEKSTLKIKYLLIPGQNDSIEGIDEFFDKMKELNVENIVADVEIQYFQKNGANGVSPHVLYLLKYMEKKANSDGFNFEYFSFAQCLLNESNLEIDENILDDKKLLISVVNRIKEENHTKNIAYPKSL